MARSCVAERAGKCLPDLMLRSSGKCGVPEGGVISPLLSNICLNDVDKMLEREMEAARHGRWMGVGCARVLRR